ncbi:MAG: hypothetical protein U1E56_09690 [Bauldia sp.]
MMPAPVQRRSLWRSTLNAAVSLLLFVEPVASAECPANNVGEAVSAETISDAVGRCEAIEQVGRFGDTICINGPIGAATFAEFSALFDGVTLAIVSSGGGDSEPAIKIAEAIWRAHLDVVFFKACYSACANYLFLAARRKFLVDDVVAAWHGSPALFPVSRVGQLGEATRETVLQRIREHEDFLTSLGEEKRAAFSRLMDEPPPRVRATRSPTSLTFNRFWWYSDEDLCSRFKVEGIVRVRRVGPR